MKRNTLRKRERDGERMKASLLFGLGAKCEIKKEYFYFNLRGIKKRNSAKISFTLFIYSKPSWKKLQISLTKIGIWCSVC